jgi:hypothetical protein
MPADQWLGLSHNRYSPGARELCCRQASGGSFRRACEDLARVGQIHVTHETMRMIVEAEGQEALRQQYTGTLGPNWTVTDCLSRPDDRSCVITGADGVKVPLVTEQEKAKRRKRRTGHRKAHRHRIRRGSDQKYKEFKILTFYDPPHRFQYLAIVLGCPKKKRSLAATIYGHTRGCLCGDVFLMMRKLQVQFRYSTKKHKKAGAVTCCSYQFYVNSGGRIRTCDLRVMGPTSYQTALPRGHSYLYIK